MLVSFLCLQNLNKMLLFWLLKTEVISDSEKCNYYFFGMTGINVHHFYEIVQLDGENWRTKDEIILGVQR